jgi:predicted nucleic-acid-binding protein
MVILAADTNVWARAYLNDDAKLAGSARAAIEAACDGDGIFVPLLVLAELSWVLSGEWEKERILDTLEHIFSTNGVVVESHTLAERALKESRSAGAGFPGRLIAEVSFAGGAKEVITFDKAFGRQPRVRQLI